MNEEFGVLEHLELFPTLPKKDNVNHPEHYNKGRYECIDVVKDLWGKNCPFPIFNAFKYIWRYKDKWNDIEDLKKAVFYLQWYIDEVEKERKERFLLPNGVHIKEGEKDCPEEMCNCKGDAQ